MARFANSRPSPRHADRDASRSTGLVVGLRWQNATAHSPYEIKPSIAATFEKTLVELRRKVVDAL